MLHLQLTHPHMLISLSTFEEMIKEGPPEEVTFEWGSEG